MTCVDLTEVNDSTDDDDEDVESSDEDNEDKSGEQCNSERVHKDFVLEMRREFSLSLFDSSFLAFTPSKLSVNDVCFNSEVSRI